MATTKQVHPHAEVGDTIYEALVNTAAGTIYADCDSTDPTVELDRCQELVRGIMRANGVNTYIFCIEASEKHSPSDIGSKGAESLSKELESIAVDAVTDQALDELASRGMIDNDDVIL